MYPIILNLNHKNITVIGGGKVAFRKVQNFLAFEQGNIQVISPDFIEAFKTLESEIMLVQDSYKETYIKDSFIVIAATDNDHVNEEIGLYCKSVNKLCNVIDNKPLSSFIVPSYVKRGNLVLAISTNGTSPSLAKRIRKDLEKQYGEDYTEYTEILGKLRAAILEKIKDEEERRNVLKEISTLNRQGLKIYEERFL